MPETVHWKPLFGGEQLITRTTVPAMDKAMAAAMELFALRPEGTYPWRVECQKSSRGARVHVTVSVQVEGRRLPNLADRKAVSRGDAV